MKQKRVEKGVERYREVGGDGYSSSSRSIYGGGGISEDTKDEMGVISRREGS